MTDVTDPFANCVAALEKIKETYGSGHAAALKELKTSVDEYLDGLSEGNRADLDPNELADILDAAHDILLTDGWIQHKARNAAGAHCAVGAIDAAVRPHGDSLSAEAALRRNAVRDVLGAVIGSRNGRHDNIPTWNDTRGRTIDEVLDAFRKAAKLLRNGEIDLATLTINNQEL